jgi:hypothetical protein
VTTAVEPVRTPPPEAMPETVPGAAPSTPARRAWLEPFTRAAVLVVLALTLVIYLLGMPALAFRWLRQPFLGGVLEQTLVFNNIGATDAPPWPAFAAGVQPGDVLRAIDGAAVNSSADVSAALAQKAAGQSAALALLRGGGATITVNVPLTGLSSPILSAWFTWSSACWSGGCGAASRPGGLSCSFAPRPRWAWAASSICTPRTGSPGPGPWRCPRPARR